MSDVSFGAALGTVLSIAVIGTVCGALYGCPQYGVYQQRLAGEAEFQRAQQNRQIRVQEAQAQLDASHLTAQAEVAKAEGVAKANEIMAKSLGGPEGYIRWKYIEMLQETGLSGHSDRSVIYVPTEAQIPIMEAGRGQGQ